MIGDNKTNLPPFVVGALVGGSSTAIAFALLGGLFSWLPGGARLAASLLAASALVAIQLRLGTKPLPQVRRQIPRTVFMESRWAGLLQFGFEYGTSMRTYITTAAPYIIGLSIVAVSPPLGSAVAVGFAFGLGRSLPVIARTLLRTPDWTEMVVRRRTPLEMGGALITLSLVASAAAT